VAELQFLGVVKSYGDRVVLDGVDLVVPEGTLTAVLGASGSGKTTLLRLLIGFVTLDAGTITVGGRVVADGHRIHVPPDKRAVGYVAQEGALFPHLTVAENVGFGLDRSGRRGGGRVGEALDLVALDRSYAGRQPHELSGGEQRRVALARALAPRPDVVLLDEPFSGLDASLRVETRAAVLDALGVAGATGVLVTHDQAEALSTGRQVAVLRDGRLAQVAAPDVLYRRPADLDLARFVGEAVVLPGEAGSGAVTCALGTLPLRGEPVEGPVQVMIRPEQIRVDPRRSGRGVTARIVGESFYGPETVLRLELTEGSALPVTARLFDGTGVGAGDQVELFVDGLVTVYDDADGASA
jgi:iron(III) transport system ATP-binding protein